MQTTSKLKLKLPNESDQVLQSLAWGNDNLKAIEAYITALTQVCSADTPSEMNFSPTHKAVNFTNLTKSGYVFSLSGGGVKVSENGFVIVDVVMNAADLRAAQRFCCDVTKNGTTFYQYSCELSYGWEATLAMSSKLFPVAKNDIIGVNLWNDNATQGFLNVPASYMNVRFYKNLNFAV